VNAMVKCDHDYEWCDSAPCMYLSGCTVTMYVCTKCGRTKEVCSEPFIKHTMQE
jgi:hypothetical protein